MIRHLKVDHGLEVDIPLQKTGRPLGGGMQGASKSAAKQAQTRFLDAKRKFEINMKNNEKKQRLLAEDAWEKKAPTNESKRAYNMRKEAFIEGFVAKGMEQYMENKEKRMQGIERRIKEGYSRHVRFSLVLLTLIVKYIYTMNIIKLSFCIL